MITIFGIQNCDTCRAARRWFESRNLDVTFHDVRRDGLDREMLERWAAQSGWEALVNRRSITWRKIPEVDRASLNESRAIRLLVDYPTLLRRPVVESGSTVIVGVDEQAYLEVQESS